METVASRRRIELWFIDQNQKRLRAVHDNLGFTMFCFRYPESVGATVRCGNVYRRKKDKTIDNEKTGILYGRILREVSEEEVRVLITAHYPDKKHRLVSGWWYEVIVD